MSDWYPKGSPGNPFPGWVVIAVLLFFALMTVLCGIDSANG